MTEFRTPEVLPEPCSACRRILVPQTRWEAASELLRQAWTARGWSPYKGRGLCRKCYGRARRTGTLDEHTRVTTPSEHLVEEWEFLRHELPVGSKWAKITYAADRIGTTPDALRLALQRQGVA